MSASDVYPPGNLLAGALVWRRRALRPEFLAVTAGGKMSFWGKKTARS